MLDQDAPSEGEAGVFPCKFLHKLAPATFSMCVSTAQARTKSAPRLGSAAFYLRILSTCPFAFRLRRLVRTVGRSHGIHLVWSCGILLVNSRILVTCPYAFRLRRLAPTMPRSGIRLVCGILPVKFSYKMAPVTCPCAFRLRRLAQSLSRGLGLRHFTCKFSHGIALVTCPYAF